MAKSIKTMIEELEEATKDRDAKFTTFEYEFVDSIAGQVEKHGGETTFLSPKQVDVIEKIHARRC